MRATMWMNLENNMLSERNQTKKVTCCMILLYEISRIGKCIERKQIGDCQGLQGGENGE